MIYIDTGDTMTTADAIEAITKMLNVFDQQYKTLEERLEDVRADLTFALTRADAQRLAPFLIAWEEFILSESDESLDKAVDAWEQIHKEDQDTVQSRHTNTL